MVKPVQPSNPSSGDGSEKYTPKEKRGPSDYDRVVEKLEKEKAAEKAKAELSKMAEETRAKKDAERPRTYTERLQDMGRLPKPSGGAGGDFSGMKGLDKPFKTGGKVSEASHKKALEKAGFYDKSKTKSEREKIVSKVTTKPQRLGMVEKLFSAKKMKSGGMASKRADGCAIKGKTKA
jgi:hypothetical protein